MKLKKLAIFIILVLCCITVLPIVVLLVEAMSCPDYNQSALAGLLAQMD